MASLCADTITALLDSFVGSQKMECKNWVHLYYYSFIMFLDHLGESAYSLIKCEIDFANWPALIKLRRAATGEIEITWLYSYF